MKSPTEALFTDPRGYGIPATPCQRAWCRILDGVPIAELWADPDVRRMCGHRLPPPGRPEQFVGTKAPRSGGSLILAAWAINRALYCDLSTGDLSRIAETENPPTLPVVSVKLRNARAIVGHVGRLMSRPQWKDCLVGRATADKVVLRHPKTGTPVAIEAIAGSAAASNLESYWCVSVAFDEVFKLKGEKDAVVNLDDARTAVRGRILPGGQIAYVGSSWVPMGPAFELLEQYFEHPARECVAVKATGPMMHPKHWTLERIKSLASSKDQRDRDVAILAMGEFLSKVTGLLSEVEIRECVRSGGDIPPKFGVLYEAAIDPALRRNAWTLVVAHREGNHLVVDLCRQWVPRAEAPLKAREVLREIAKLVKPYSIRELNSDQWSSGTLGERAEDYGLGFRDCQKELRGALGQQALQAVVDSVQNNAIELPTDEDLVKDLLQLKRKATQQGTVLYLAPTPDGRHADYVPSLALVELRLPKFIPLDLARALPAGFLDNPKEEETYPDEELGILRPAPAAY